MFRKLILILICTLIIFNVHALEVDQFPENQETNNSADIAKMKGELTLKIQEEANNTRLQLKEQQKADKEELKEYINEKTNPLYMNLPTILFIMVLVLVWGILKGRGKL